MIGVVAHLEGGTSYGTSVNPQCSDDEIRRYFVGQVFNIGNADRDDCRICTHIEIHRECPPPSSNPLPLK